MPTLEREKHTGETMQVGSYQITPQTNVIKIRLPGMHSGLIWNRPWAVIVRSVDGQEIHLPVRDVTRIAIWSMLVGGLVGAILFRLMRRRQ
jgi:hypothetical protein